MKKLLLMALAAGSILSLSACGGPEAKTAMFEATEQGQGKRIGTVVFVDTKKGLQVSMKMRGLPPGDHGFRIHENGGCSRAERDAAAAADKDRKNDLPVLKVSKKGHVNKTIFVKDGPKVAEIKNRPLVIHDGEARISCGVIK